MQARLVEDWLTKINERGFELPFCQSLLADGHQILFVGHSPYEDGKDILSISSEGQLHAYQLKTGDLDLKELEYHQSQITALVEAAVRHPSISSGTPHLPFFVVTGEIKNPVLNRVDNLNTSWKQRGHNPLTLIGGRELHARFLNLSSDFWPDSPPEVRSFLGMFLSTGKGDLDRSELALFLTKLLKMDDVSPKTSYGRKITAANIFTSYLLKEFYTHADHWSIFCGWTIVASHVAWIAERMELTERDWKGAFDLAVSAAEAALKALNEETLQTKALAPKRHELDSYTRARNTIAASAAAAWHLIEKKRGSPLDRRVAVDLILRLESQGRFLIWGESAVPHLLAIFWFLENFSANIASDRLLLSLIRGISARNGRGATQPLPDPYQSAEDALADAFSAPEHEGRGNKSVDSYTIESLVLLAAKRLLRQSLAAMWSRVTRVEMAGFHPDDPADLLLWHCDTGQERHRWPNHPESWSNLKAQASTDESACLPNILKANPSFALMFFLAFPHRISTPFVKMLDVWLK